MRKTKCREFFGEINFKLQVFFRVQIEVFESLAKHDFNFTSKTNELGLNFHNSIFSNGIAVFLNDNISCHASQQGKIRTNRNKNILSK